MIKWMCHSGTGALAWVASLCCALPGVCVRAATSAELYAAARAEQTLVFYAGGPAAPWEASAREFEQRYPGIAVSVTGGFSNVLDRKIDEQLNQKKLEVDLAIFQTLADFVRWKRDRMLLPFKPEGFDKIHASFKDPDGAYVGVMVNAHPYEYNTQLVRPQDVPKSAKDFLNPLFRGKVVAAYPADDDATLYVFHNIVKKYGWEYMDKYMANKPNFIQGHLGEQRSISAGENLVTFDSILGITLKEMASGKPVQSFFSNVDPMPIWPLTAAVFKDAPHPNAAKLFLSWYLEPQQQTRLGTWSVRSDVRPPAGLQPIFSYRVANGYRAFLSDQQLIADLRKRFEAYTGPVVNKGGVR
jgi:ABC-type Fe3+ transport system substrate-binding protein